MNRKFLAGIVAVVLFAFGGTSTALASNYQVFSETQSFSNNGYGGAGCGAPAYEEVGWKVVAGGAELTSTQLSEGDYVTDGFPANLGTEFPAWGINVASVNGHSPGSTKTYAVCIKEPKDGVTGATGPEGPKGTTGATGATGPEGKEGKAGNITVGSWEKEQNGTTLAKETTAAISSVLPVFVMVSWHGGTMRLQLEGSFTPIETETNSGAISFILAPETTFSWKGTATGVRYNDRTL